MRTTCRFDGAVDWLMNSRHTGDPDIQEPFWAYADGLITRDQLDTFNSASVRHRRRQLGLVDGGEPGHGLPPLKVDGHKLPRAEVSAAGDGDARISCECGATSPELPGRPARRQWHHAHKVRVAAGEREPADDYFDEEDA